MNISIIISIGSLVLSFLTYLYVKGTVEVFTIWKRGIFSHIIIDDGTESPTILSASEGNEIVAYRVEISNTSNQNVGLSAFRIIDSNNKQIKMLTSDNVYGTYGHQGAAMRLMNSDGSGMIAHLPQNLSNNISAKQTTVYDIVTFESKNSSPQPFSIFLVYSTIKTNLLPWGNKIRAKENRYDLILQRGIKKSLILTLKSILINFWKRILRLLHI